MLADNTLKNKINCILFDDNEVIILCTIYTILLKKMDPKDQLPEWLGLFSFLVWPEKKQKQIFNLDLRVGIPSHLAPKCAMVYKCGEVEKSAMMNC